MNLAAKVGGTIFLIGSLAAITFGVKAIHEYSNLREMYFNKEMRISDPEWVSCSDRIYSNSVGMLLSGGPIVGGIFLYGYGKTKK